MPRSPTATGWLHAAARAEDAAILWAALWRASDELASVLGRDAPAIATADYGADAGSDAERYRRWIAEQPADPQGAAVTVPGGPRISVVVPVFRPDLALFHEAVRSVLSQSYGRLELCLCDDGSGDRALSAALGALAQSDARVKVTALGVNGGISAATNAALGLANGEWVAFMDQDDLLAPDALRAVAEVVAADPDVDVVYTDDDKIDRYGNRSAPQFKCDWNPDLLLSMCYVAHLVAMRRSLVSEVGGLRPAYDGSQDWDLVLRVSERARAVRHVPRVLYHWRATPGSAAGDAFAKPWARMAGRRAVQDALARRAEPADVTLDARFAGYCHVRREPDHQPTVSAVVVSGDDARALGRCLDSLVSLPPGVDLDVVVVHAGSTDPETAALFERVGADARVSVVHRDGPFSWPALVNAGIAASHQELVLLLDPGLTATCASWLRTLAAQALRPEIGAAGARVVRPDGSLEHAGMVVGLGGAASAPMHGLRKDAPGYMGAGVVTRDWSAVSGGCLLARRTVVEELGGFDETLPSYSDIDLCLRAVERGYRIVVTATVELVSADGLVGGCPAARRDIVPFVTRWMGRLGGEDPMSSPHLSRLDARGTVRLATEDDRWRHRLERLGRS